MGDRPLDARGAAGVQLPGPRPRGPSRVRFLDSVVAIELMVVSAVRPRRMWKTTAGLSRRRTAPAAAHWGAQGRRPCGRPSGFSRTVRTAARQASHRSASLRRCRSRRVGAVTRPFALGGGGSYTPDWRIRALSHKIDPLRVLGAVLASSSLPRRTNAARPRQTTDFSDK